MVKSLEITGNLRQSVEIFLRKFPSGGCNGLRGAQRSRLTGQIFSHFLENILANAGLAGYWTGARAKKITSSEISGGISLRCVGAHALENPRTSVGSSRRVRHASLAQRFPLPLPPWRGAVTARAHCLQNHQVSVLPLNYSGELHAIPQDELETPPSAAGDFETADTSQAHQNSTTLQQNP